MIKTRAEQTKTSEYNNKGGKAFDLYDLKEFNGINPKIKQFSYVELDCGEEVPFHVHEGNAENYYIISGSGIYNDNGKDIPVSDGVITFTPSGQGHALKNTGNEKLCFIALVLLN
ncbi:MAG: cupin domain-containing protein [Clostridiales bacterium]|nr:cupin domain-containing protein [Clostridiales bacterium]MBQ3047240.1 cupin domain-containing protein [Clostridia bacterium]